VQHCARQSDALSLPSRQRFAALAHCHVEAARMAVHEVGHACDLGGGDDRGIVRERQPKAMFSRSVP